MSAMHPTFSYFSRKFIPLFKPDLVLVQSYETEKMFENLGCETEFFPCGVDVRKFIPFNARVKSKLREKYGIDRGKFVILHVGSIKRGRNVQMLKKLQKGDNQVIVIGSTSAGVDQELCKELKNSGCIVWIRYFERIEEIYGLSDCYVFPTTSKKDFLGKPISDSIEMPLSILEAMACNLPVISTRFGALPRVFDQDEGLIYVDKEEDFLKVVEKIKNDIKNGIKIRNREKILPYSWVNVAEKLQQIYANIISE
jgi:glycosyltransferase involved in cell wall biosynthesis